MCHVAFLFFPFFWRGAGAWGRRQIQRHCCAYREQLLSFTASASSHNTATISGNFKKFSRDNPEHVALLDKPIPCSFTDLWCVCGNRNKHFFSSNPALHGAFKVLCSNSLLRSFRGNTSGHNKVYLLLFKKKNNSCVLVLMLRQLVLCCSFNGI